MRAAFYDFDGTLAASNVVTRYFYFARRVHNPIDLVRRTSTVILGIPYWLYLDSRSRKHFNEVFYLLYQGLGERWLARESKRMLEKEVLPKMFPGSEALVEADRAAGYTPVLVTGGLDFAIQPVADLLGFDHLLANRMIFKDGVASGRLADPVLAEEGKVKVIREFCDRYNVETTKSKAYSDSLSDLPMLELVGKPSVVNPDGKLRAVAAERGWPVLSTRKP